MIAEFLGLVYAPVRYDQVMTVGAIGSGVSVTPQMRDRLGVMTQPEFVAKDAAPGPPLTRNAAGAPVVRVEFIEGTEKVVHVCTVHVVAFDLTRHDIAKLQHGDCDVGLVAGMPKLRVGHLQAWRTPGNTDDNFIAL